MYPITHGYGFLDKTKEILDSHTKQTDVVYGQKVSDKLNRRAHSGCCTTKKSDKAKDISKTKWKSVKGAFFMSSRISPCSNASANAWLKKAQVNVINEIAAEIEELDCDGILTDYKDLKKPENKNPTLRSVHAVADKCIDFIDDVYLSPEMSPIVLPCGTITTKESYKKDQASGQQKFKKYSDKDMRCSYLVPGLKAIVIKHHFEVEEQVQARFTPVQLSVLKATNIYWSTTIEKSFRTEMDDLVQDVVDGRIDRKTFTRRKQELISILQDTGNQQILDNLHWIKTNEYKQTLDGGKIHKNDNVSYKNSNSKKIDKRVEIEQHDSNITEIYDETSEIGDNMSEDEQPKAQNIKNKQIVEQSDDEDSTEIEGKGKSIASDSTISDDEDEKTPLKDSKFWDKKISRGGLYEMEDVELEEKKNK